MVGRCRVWHVIIDIGKYTPLNDIDRGMPSSTFDRIHSRTTSGVDAFLDLRLKTLTVDVGRGMPTLPLGNKHGWMLSSVPCHHGLLKEHTV